MKPVIHIGGVPEHFNYPFRFALEAGMFAGYPFKVQWHEEPAGTGALCQNLDEGRYQLAVVLTEGVVKHIADGSPSRLLASYIASPLIWGIHVAAKSAIRYPQELAGKRYAVSRMGSGSHLMAYVDAAARGFEINKEQLEITGGLEGTRTAFKENRADVLFWEKYITMPLVRSGEFRCVGECITPWPCFVISANDQFMAQHTDFAELIINTMQAACRLFMNLPDADAIIAREYNLHLEDARHWFYKTEWKCERSFSKKAIINAVEALQQVGLINKSFKFKPENIVSNITQMV